MTYRPQTVKCFICKIDIQVSEVKYHTAREEGSPAKPFCGPECSLQYYEERNKENS